jgi:pyroglutamyl-peptidase
MRSSVMPVRILVTGFGPFPGIPYNAAEALVRTLAEDAQPPEIELSTEIVPVLWADARAVARNAIARMKPHAVLHFGVSKRASVFEVESRALNISGQKRDQRGAMRPAQMLVRSGDTTLNATLPAPLLVRALRKRGYPAQLSRDAGRYLCNALFYWSLTDALMGGPRVAFIHIPALGIEAAARSRLTMEQIIGGARVLIRESSGAILSAATIEAKRNGGSGGHGSQALYVNRRSGGMVWYERG